MCKEDCKRHTSHLPSTSCISIGNLLLTPLASRRGSTDWAQLCYLRDQPILSFRVLWIQETLHLLGRCCYQLLQLRRMQTLLPGAPHAAFLGPRHSCTAALRHTCRLPARAKASSSQVGQHAKRMQAACCKNKLAGNASLA